MFYYKNLSLKFTGSNNKLVLEFTCVILMIILLSKTWQNTRAVSELPKLEFRQILLLIILWSWIVLFKFITQIFNNKEERQECTLFVFFHIRTVHLDIIKVLFILQLMHQWVVLKKNIKIYINICIITASTYFGVTVTPSSGSALICVYQS